VAAAARAAPDPAPPEQDAGPEAGEPEPAAPLVPEPEPAAPLVVPEPAAPVGAAPVIPPVDIVNDAQLRVAAAAPQLAGVWRGRVGPTVPWETIVCALCGQPAGQIKLEPNPGQRDGPTWHMRTVDPATKTWAVSGPRHRTRRTSVIGEAPIFAMSWCEENRLCCPQQVPA